MSKRKEAKSTLQLLADFAFFCLMIVGVGGVMFKFLMPDGWISIWMHEIWRFNPGYMLVVAVFALIAFLLGKRWMDGFNTKTSLGDLIMYAWIALGLYFIFKLVVTGAF